MLHPAKSHIITAEEIELLLNMGYSINLPVAEAIDFINDNFANLDIGLLALVSEGALAKLNAQPALIRSIEMHIGAEPEMIFELRNEEYDDPATGVSIKRTFYKRNSKLLVSHDVLTIPEAHRDQGLARLIFRTWIQQYVNAGVQKIKVSAGFSDGGYVWARNFFTADKRSEMDIILNKAKEHLGERHFNAVKMIYELYYTEFPTGEAFPIAEWAALPFMKNILRYTFWDGTMDLNNSEQFDNFIKYIFK